MGSLLEIIALHPADAEAAQEGGADRLELCASMEADGLSVAITSSGHGAPIWTHAAKWSMTSCGSLLLGGICTTSPWRMALMIKLSSGLPAMSAGP